MELTGNEKQVAWAETIRAEMVMSLEKDIENNFDQHTEKKAMSVLDWVKAQKDAEWWIENRDIECIEDAYYLWIEAGMEN